MPQSPEQIALERIRQAADSGAESLDLSGLGLTSLPPEIGRLTNLDSMLLFQNKLTSLPPEISQLTGLTHLSLWDNKLSNLSLEIVQLTNLTELDLSKNQLTSLPPEIGQLASLQNLELSENQLTSLPPEIGQLTNLTKLDLFFNQLTSLPFELWKLPELKNLSISGNPFSEIPTELWRKTDLKELDMSGLGLAALPPEIGQLTNLTELNISYNQLTSLPLEIIRLHKLGYINLRGNPLEIAIPAKWLEPDNWGGRPHTQEILAHYKRIYEEGGRELGEARVLVVGEGGVGKTSIVKRLIDNTFDDKEDTTLIVEKRPLPLGDVRAQVWDFGGQEHMHATHQFFFSGRSLYLLVFDTRGSLEQNKVDYWLTLINAYSKNASVILVGNKCDQHEMDVEKRTLLNRYPNICGFVGTSARTGENIERLRHKIQEEVRAMPQVRVLFSADYLAVKEEMETLSAAHISHEEFVRVCERHGVNDEKDQDNLLDLLHDLGTVLYFRDADGNPLLPALGVLNPNWVTRGVYLIVTHPALKDKHKGRLTMKLLREILSAPEYSRHCEDIAKLLERFELCYRADDSSYWLPSLMEKDEPAALGDFSSAMKFEYWHPELPKSVIVRFIVKAHKMILDNKVWRYGAVLKLDGNTALVRADEHLKRVSIFIAGEESTRRDALAILRAHFDDIHARFATPPQAYIYPPQCPSLYLPFEKMKRLLKTGTTTIPDECNNKPITINLRELLDGFVTPQERRKDEEREEKEFGRRGNIHVHIGDMHGSSLTIGDNNATSVSVQNSFNALPAEIQIALAELLRKAEETLSQVQDPDDKEILQSALDKLKTSKPNKKWYSVSVEGLIQAAKNLNELGTPVIDLAGKILNLLSPLP
ncbi:MAG: leucine-rich repeat domain-containing protein [Chloroflexi bacterium]|nr:leucine-rich repeat domain-containing protein [Chloroflexota bacterium]MCA2001527.1 leucine-rich repeat domain-containing protein [Chloroflexota bacterium]